MAKVKAEHFRVLDAFRGIGCVIVALGHWPSGGFLWHTGVMPTGVLVDFFFVLSGFVMAENYDGRMNSPGGAARFVWLRIGRIYPLHMAAIALMVLFELASLGVSLGLTGTPGDAFSGRRDPTALIDNLTLTQIFGFHEAFTWNGPSWSIAAEMWTYLAFAVLTVIAGRFRYVAYAVAAVLCYLVLAQYSANGLYNSFGLSVFRCGVGFLIGVLVWRALQFIRSRCAERDAPIAWTAMESAALAIPIYFTFFTGPDRLMSLISPPYIAAFVLIFAQEKGAVSRALNNRWLVYLGTLSFSVYLLHKPLLTVIAGGLKAFEHFTGVPSTHIGVFGDLNFGSNALTGDLLFIPYIALVIGISHLSYRYFEEPARLAFRNSRVASWLRARETTAAEPARRPSRKAAADASA